MLINGAWYINELPNDIVLELPNGALKHTELTPFRYVKETDLNPYNGYHPRKIKGQPVPDYLYPFYGLEKSAESLSEVIRVRVSPSEKSAFKIYTASLEPRRNVADVLREFIRSKI
jgi:hypothetical protein